MFWLVIDFKKFFSRCRFCLVFVDVIIMCKIGVRYVVVCVIRNKV